MSAHRKVTRSNSDGKGELNDTALSAIVERLDTLFKEMHEFRLESKDMAKSIDSTHEKIDDLTKLVQRHDMDLKRCDKNIEVVKSENVYLRGQVEDLKADIVSWNQYSRMNCVDIEGVPVVNNENIMDVTRAVLRVVRFELRPDMVDTMHRLGSRGPSQTRPPSIILKFVRRLDKDELLRLAKVKPGFAASEAGYASENKIFIRQSMSQENRHLFSLTRTIGRSLGFKYVWFANSKILMREADRATVIHVRSKVQVLQLAEEVRRRRGEISDRAVEVEGGSP